MNGEGNGQGGDEAASTEKRTGGRKPAAKKTTSRKTASTAKKPAASKSTAKKAAAETAPTEKAASEGSGGAPRSGDRPSGIRAGAVVAMAIVAGFLIWLVFLRGDGDSDSEPIEPGSGPVEASESDLADIGERLGYPIYWAGDQDDATVEVTETVDGRVYVRYLTDDAELGDPRPDFLTIGTYPFEDAFGALEKLAAKPGARTETGDDGQIIVSNEGSPNSAYVASPGDSVQVEVYDPDPDRAFEVASGEVEPAD